TTRGATNDYSSVDCLGNNLSGPDVVYAITLGVNAKLRITPTATFNQEVYYLTAACGGAQGLRCGQAFGQGFTTDTLAPGTY
ncbi:hypothetical protein ACEWAJ_24245, partial [Vibrio parahaemolyticus]